MMALVQRLRQRFPLLMAAPCAVERCMLFLLLCCPVWALLERLKVPVIFTSRAVLCCAQVMAR